MLQIFIPVCRSRATWWLLFCGKSFRFDDTMYLGLALNSNTQSQIVGGTSASQQANVSYELFIISQVTRPL
jgi:hypothetical protein